MKRILVLVCMVLFLGSFVSAEYSTAADRFVNNNDGTVTDTQAGLMWADHDNGSDINWTNANIYCNGYSGGGKSGWRLPTVDELRQVYNSAYGSVIKKTSVAVWASETNGSEAALFYYTNYYWYPQSFSPGARVLPVRSSK